METNGNTDDSSAVTAREKLNAYLGMQMKVAVSDGRVLIGEFMCTDKDRNLILGNCDEYIPLSECSWLDKRIKVHHSRGSLLYTLG